MISSMVYLKKGSNHENNEKNSCDFDRACSVPRADGIDGWSGGKRFQLDAYIL